MLLARPSLGRRRPRAGAVRAMADVPAVLASSLGSLLRNKLRTSLTILGIAIGIAAVICVVAIGSAGQARVEQHLRNLGDNFVWIEAGARAVNGVRTGPRGTRSLTIADAVAIEHEVPLIKSVSANVDASVQVIHGNQNWYTTYRGVGPAYFPIKNWVVDRGALFDQDDVDRAACVCVLAHTVARQLFGADDPIGKVVRLGSLPCKVVATLRPKGPTMTGGDQDDMVVIPYTTAMKRLMGQPFLDDILCSAVSQDLVKTAGKQAAALLRERHHLRPDEDDDFNIRNPEDVIQAQIEASKTMTLLLLAIASISLIVGGIGIMNVMLVSVTERTREIGLRVAVGATPRAIRIQFLFESTLLSLVGGAAGVLLGVVGSALTGSVLGWPVDVSAGAVLVASLVSIGVGVFFGYYPARRASRLDPIAALRHE